MKTILKILGVTVVLILLFAAYVEVAQPLSAEAPLTGISASTDSSVIERGKYLVNGPAHCGACHAPGMEKEPMKGVFPSLSGGGKIELPFGTIHVPNITPDIETGIGRYTDEQLAGVIRYNVHPTKRALAPFMTYNEMSDEDVTAIISYLRNTRPVHNAIPAHELNFIGKIITKLLLKPILPEKPPVSVPKDTSVSYGRYLAFSVANCKGCHTERSKTGEFIGVPFAGGHQMTTDRTIFTTPNLTPDKSTGQLVNWHFENFMNRFHAGVSFEDSPMPWNSFQNISEPDLKAIYNFLNSLEPVNNPVTVYKLKS